MNGSTPTQDPVANKRKTSARVQFENKTSASKFDPQEIENFQHGILQRDYAAVEQALAAGVSADTPVYNGMHALQILLFNMHSGANAYPRRMSEKDFSKETSRLVELVLANAGDLIEPQKYMTQYHNTLADHLLNSGRLADASKVIVHAIHQSLQRYGRAYEPNLDTFVAAWVDAGHRQGGQDMAEMVADGLRHYKALHDVVRARIENPAGVIEAELILKHDKKIEAWTEEFLAPPVQMFLPRSGRPHNNGRHQDEGENDDNNRPEPEKNAGKPDPKNAMGKFVTVLPKRSVEEVMADINKLVGLDEYKQAAEDCVIGRIAEAAREAHKLKPSTETRHAALSGNPGVGKTTLARLDAELNYALGLGGNRFAEITREKIMAAHIGGIEVNFRELVDQADYVFVDEFSTFTAASYGRDDKQDFGHRVVEACLPILENERSKKIFAFADCPENLSRALDSNVSFRRRIGRFINIPDPDVEQLKKGMDKLLGDMDWKITEEAKNWLGDRLKEAKEILGSQYFGNFGSVRNVVEKLPRIVNRRLFGSNKADITNGIYATPTKEELTTILLEDAQKLNVMEVLGVTEFQKREKENRGPKIGFTANI